MHTYAYVTDGAEVVKRNTKTVSFYQPIFALRDEVGLAVNRALPPQGLKLLLIWLQATLLVLFVNNIMPLHALGLERFRSACAIL